MTHVPCKFIIAGASRAHSVCDRLRAPHAQNNAHSAEATQAALACVPLAAVMRAPPAVPSHVLATESSAAELYCAACARFIWGANTLRCACCRRAVHAREECRRRLAHIPCRTDWLAAGDPRAADAAFAKPS